jgi:glycosyltransferase involved in cell wall biosynthesis
MAAGRPVLYSSAAPLETLAGGEGIRFAANDVKALGESLRDTLRHQDGWAALGERGRERAARFDWSLVLPAWEQALRAAVG